MTCSSSSASGRRALPPARPLQRLLGGVTWRSAHADSNLGDMVDSVKGAGWDGTQGGDSGSSLIESRRAATGGAGLDPAGNPCHLLTVGTLSGGEWRTC